MMGSDSMWSDYRDDYLFASEQSDEKRERWEAEQAELRQEVPDWLHSKFEGIANELGTGLSYWKGHGRFRCYFGSNTWVDVRAEREKGLDMGD